MPTIPQRDRAVGKKSVLSAIFYDHFLQIFSATLSEQASIHAFCYHASELIPVK
jgi:hypothetical protein